MVRIILKGMKFDWTLEFKVKKEELKFTLSSGNFEDEIFVRRGDCYDPSQNLLF